MGEMMGDVKAKTPQEQGLSRDHGSKWMSILTAVTEQPGRTISDCRRHELVAHEIGRSWREFYVRLSEVESFGWVRRKRVGRVVQLYPSPRGAMFSHHKDRDLRRWWAESGSETALAALQRIAQRNQRPLSRIDVRHMVHYFTVELGDTARASVVETLVTGQDRLSNAVAQRAADWVFVLAKYDLVGAVAGAKVGATMKRYDTDLMPWPWEIVLDRKLVTGPTGMA